MAFQIAAITAPPTASATASANDVIFGGIGSKSELLQIYDHGLPGRHTSQDIKDIFNHFKITRADLDSMRSGTADSRDRRIYSMGRKANFKEDVPVRIGGTTFFLRPLYVWDKNNPYNVYPALIGERKIDGTDFGIMLDCGNLFFWGIPPTPSSPKPKPSPTPTPTPAPTPKPKPPTVPKEPNISIAKQAHYFATGRDANNTKAKPGDIIEYTLLVKNTGTGAKNGYVIEENINDILEYATLVSSGGGTLNSQGTLVWPAERIGAGQLIHKKFQIKVKSPIPATPVSTSDPTAFDLRIDNVFGNRVSIELPAPPAKQVELASAQLPRTGVGSTLLVFAFVGLCVYFYSRNRQLITEINILRAEQSHGGGH